MLSFNLTLLIFELKRQLSIVKQNKNLFMETYRQGFPLEVKEELSKLDYEIESLKLQIQLLEE